MAETPRKTRLRHFIRDIWDEGRSDLVDDYIAASYYIEHDPGDPWHGQTLDREGYRQRLIQSRSAFPDQTFAIQHLVEDGDAVVMTWQWQATHLGAVGEFLPTGRTITMSGATVYLFDAQDQLQGHWQITDRLGVFVQLSQNQQSLAAKPD